SPTRPASGERRGRAPGRSSTPSCCGASARGIWDAAFITSTKILGGPPFGLSPEQPYGSLTGPRKRRMTGRDREEAMRRFVLCLLLIGTASAQGAQAPLPKPTSVSKSGFWEIDFAPLAKIDKGTFIITIDVK